MNASFIQSGLNSKTQRPKAAKGKKGIAHAGRAILAAAAATAASIFGASSTHAADIQLQNGNSSVTINPTAPAPSGVIDWTINGQNQINDQWFFYRIGSTGGQSSVAQLGLTKTTTLDTTGDGHNDYTSEVYGSSTGLQITIGYDLTGGQPKSGTADLAETVKLVNNTKSSMTLHFFDYANFTLDGTTHDAQNVAMSGMNTITQTGAGGDNIEQTVVSPKASLYQFGTASSLLSEIDGTTNPAALNDSGMLCGSSDPAYAYEWDITLGAGKSEVLSFDEQLRQVPEPASSAALFGVAGIFLARPRRRDDDPDPRTAQVAEA